MTCTRYFDPVLWSAAATLPGGLILPVGRPIITVDIKVQFGIFDTVMALGAGAIAITRRPNYLLGRAPAKQKVGGKNSDISQF